MIKQIILNIKNKVKEYKYKSTTIYKCDYEFYDIPIYLIDFEESDNNV